VQDGRREFGGIDKPFFANLFLRGVLLTTDYDDLIMWSQILQTALRGPERRIEISEERSDESSRWQQEFCIEIKNFRQKVKDFDLSDPSERGEFYEQVSESHERLQELRYDERIILMDDADLLAEFDKLLSSFEEMSPPHPWCGGSGSMEPERTKIAQGHRMEVTQLIKQVCELL